MPTPAAGDVQLRQFTANYEALGIVVDFLVERPPFDQFPTGKLIPALKRQRGGARRGRPRRASP